MGAKGREPRARGVRRRARTLAAGDTLHRMDVPAGEPDLEQLLAALPAFLAHLDLDGRFLYLNRLADGYTREQVAGTSIFDFTAPSDRDAVRACMQRVIETKQHAGVSTTAAGPHGRPVPYYTLLSPVLEGGEVRSMMLLATDVSHVVEAHAALAASEDKLRFVVGATGMGIWMFDPHRMITEWDANIAQLHGYEPVAMSMSSPDTLKHMHPDDLPLLIELMTKRLPQTGSYGPHEHRIVRLDGGVRWVAASGRLRWVDDKTYVVIGGLIDITERKLREERVAQALRLESIGRLAGGVAHDFNNMLTAILGYAELCIASAERGRAPSIADLREIKRAAERSRDLTSRLLSFARKQDVEQRIIEPNRVVEQLVRLLERILGEDITLVTQLTATNLIRIDPGELEQLLVNLATNARDAMPAGGRLELATEDVDIGDDDPLLGAGPHVRIRVSDTGSGIEPERLAQVFEPFYSTKEPDKGTGLGLAQCYGIARQAGGQLRITSQVGAGTQVTLDLPAASGAPLVEPTTSRKAPPSTGTVLLVEDEVLVRTLAARILTENGLRVLEASRGREALELAARHAGAIDILLTDVVMPDMDGNALATELARLCPKIAVVMMSGYRPQQEQTARPKHFVQKPFSPDDLLDKLRTALATE